MNRQRNLYRVTPCYTGACWERGRCGEYVWLIIYGVDKEVNNKSTLNGRHYAALVPLPQLASGAATPTILPRLVSAEKFSAIGWRRERPAGGVFLRSTASLTIPELHDKSTALLIKR